MAFPLKTIFLSLACLIVSVLLAFWIATQDYVFLSLFVISTILGLALAIPGYTFLIAFGLLCPFILPLPFISGFPVLGFVLGLTSLKYFLTRAVSKKPKDVGGSLTPAVILFFAWVLVRYLANPVGPGIAIGIGEGVTGFRAYSDYLLCFSVLFVLRYFITDRDTIQKLFHWMALLSFAFILLFVPLIFTKSLFVAQRLSQLGVFVTFFDNGWLRFVALPDYGIMLLALALLPNLYPKSRNFRILTFGIGLSAVVMGGNRSSLAMAFALILVIAFVRRRMLLMGGASVFVGLCLVVLAWLGENLQFERGVGFMRVASLVSGRAANMTDAAQNVVWRKIRWERALHDIYANPLLGVGYGGLDRAFVFGNWQQWEDARVEVDVASGTIHNGYLSAARALGIPACLLFIYIFCRQIYLQAKQGLRLSLSAPLDSELHALIAAILVTLALHIYIGLDLNHYRTWFFIGLGVLLLKFNSVDKVKLHSPELDSSLTKLTPKVLQPIA